MVLSISGYIFVVVDAVVFGIEKGFDEHIFGVTQSALRRNLPYYPAIDFFGGWALVSIWHYHHFYFRKALFWADKRFAKLDL